MNVTVKPKAFQKRKPSPIAAQATGSAETFVRYVIARAVEQLDRSRDAYAIASTRFPGDARLRTVIRASAEPPTDLSNAPALAVMAPDYIESLQPISAAAQLFRASRLMLSFDRSAAITVPDLVGLEEGPPAWVEAGQPAPVGELTSNATTLTPFKLEFIVTVTREMLLGSNAEKLIGDALRTKIAFDLDKALFDALPASAARPAGLRSYNTRLPESTFTSGNDVAMMQDVGSLISAAEHIAGNGAGEEEGTDRPRYKQFYFIARSRRIAAMRQMYSGQVPPNFALLASAASLALPESVLMCVVPRAVPSAVGLPEVELVESAAVEIDDAPTSPDVMGAQNVRSFFQSDTFGLKVRLPASWGLRHPAGANWITCLWPADMGAGTGGGIPDAPADAGYYGRHMSGWEPVVEEAPAITRAGSAAANAYARHGATGWIHLDAALTDYLTDSPTDGFTYGRRQGFWQQLETAFASLNSPAFIGTPTAPQPPPGDASTRLATTQFVADNAGAGGGVDEVPATPNGAFARVRTGATASWLDFVTLRVAPLDSPIFDGIPRSTVTPPVGTNSNVLATCDFVARDYLALAGGTMTGQLIAATGGAQTNVSLGFGDLQTGFYRTAGVLVCTVTGQAVVQFTPALSAFFGPVNFTNNVLSGVGDAVAAADALNLRTGDSRYLRSGGGPIIAPPGNAPNDVGLGVGDATTGFYRQGASLAISALGDTHMLFNNNRTMQVLWPLNLSGNAISNLGDATAADHALNRGSADARYLQPADADALYHRAPAVAYDLPANVNVPATGAFVTLASIPFTPPGSSQRRIMVSVSCSFADIATQLAMIDVRLPGGPSRRMWLYSAQGATSGFTTDLTAVVVGPALINIPIEVSSVGVGGPPQALTVLGGGGLVSQIVVIDLGPAA